ncbi:hypothetical protein ACFY9F_37805 [Streptomyces sp. NPDC012421]|uniref:hypothetical protein n=1 Tax=Streptomyces sp. NPDC012421 TaxID=3364832 RepID=UPI0036F05B46
MTDGEIMTQYLGPLEQVGDRWVIGDPKRLQGSCLVLTSEGIEHHVRAAGQPRRVVEWNRLSHVELRATMRPWMATRTGGIIMDLGGGHLDGGRSGCSVSGILHPYEPWSVNYTHHERTYTTMHIALLSDLFVKTSEAKALHRLGDPEWLGAVVARLAPTPRWTPLPGRRVSEIIELLGR